MPDARLLGIAGAVGAASFAVIVAVLTGIHWSFLRERGWDPVRTNDIPFPSILALSATGWLQVVNFAILGLALLAVAAGLWQALDPRPTVAIFLVGAAGAAGLALMAPTDGSLSSVRSWPGAIHVGAFFTLLVCVVLAALLLGLALGSLQPWAAIASGSIAAAVLIVVLTIVSFVVGPVGSLASILSILAMLGWLELIAVRLATAP